MQRAELTTMSVQQSGAPTGSQETWAAVRALYERGLQAYAAACAHADARVGDDVAGLLQNWGAGLLSLAEVKPIFLELAIVLYLQSFFCSHLTF